jgi:hypothetical protein
MVRNKSRKTEDRMRNATSQAEGKGNAQKQIDVASIPSVTFSFSFGSVGFPFADGILLSFIILSIDS